MDCPKSINILEEYPKYQDDFIDMLTPFQSMWDRHLQRNSAVKHWVDLESPASWAIQLTPFRAGLVPHDFEWSETEHILAMNLMDPEQTKWASSFVSAPKKTGTLRFLFISEGTTP